MTHKFTPTVTVDPKQTDATEVALELVAVKSMQIASDADAQEWAEQAREVKRQIKETEAARKTVTGPLDAAKKAIDALFAPRREKLAALDAWIGGELGRWSLVKLAAQKEQMRLAAAAANAGDTAGLTTALQKVQEAAPTKMAGVSIRPVWVATVVDSGLVPREWCVPDERRIAEFAKKCPVTQAPTMPGVKFELSTARRVCG